MIATIIVIHIVKRFFFKYSIIKIRKKYDIFFKVLKYCNYDVVTLLFYLKIITEIIIL